ncbi:MAG: hypothetical protein ACO1NX_10030 [Chitinophagaceae bacterium]
MGNKYEAFASQAADMTDAQFKERFATLTRLNIKDLEKIMNDTGISHHDMAELLKEVKNASHTNEKKAVAIKNINGGVSTLIAMVKTFL